jgi:hypothetical protein
LRGLPRRTGGLGMRERAIPEGTKVLKKEKYKESELELTN